MAVTDTPEANRLTEPHVAITTRAWWHRHLDPDERRRVMDELAITPVESWAWRFTVMLTLSVLVAVMGLSADSAAVVIGAMLLAPLMQPVLATAACLSMSLVLRSMRSLVKVALATAWCIGIAYAISTILPDVALSDEVLARTRPDVRDLVVALAAGAAGAYATVRRDVSSSLPGVAVAVALVPPLGTVGISLEAGETDLAFGALLLYVTNLAAIIFAGVMVFIATGFVPPRRLANTGVQLLAAAVIAFGVVAAIAVPLFNRSALVVAAAEDEVTARGIVEEWLTGVALEPTVDVRDDEVFVQLRGIEDPPDDATLREQLQLALGADVTVNVEWIRTQRATTTTTAPPAAEEALLAEVGPIVDRWLADNDGGADYERLRLRLVGEVIVVDVTGTGSPPPVPDLIDRLRQSDTASAFGVRVAWTERRTITAEDQQETPDEVIVERVWGVADRWAAETGTVVVSDVEFDGERVLIQVIGLDAPPIESLVADVQAVVEDVDDRRVLVDVFLTRQERVTTVPIVVDAFGGFVPTIADGGTPTPTTTVPASTTPTTTVPGG